MFPALSEFVVDSVLDSVLEVSPSSSESVVQASNLYSMPTYTEEQ